MSTHRHDLPNTHGEIFLTDGGIETTLIFDDGLDLPDFAAFDLLRTEVGRRHLVAYFRTYASLAAGFGVGLVLETPTWRASADWGARLGYSPDDVRQTNRDAVALVAAVRSEFETPATPVVVSGCIGPRGDGYDPGELMTVDQARQYHELQAETFAGTVADMIDAITITNTPEAIGIVKAARDAKMPVVISFTVETDGHLPTGQKLGDAIIAVDEATDGYPEYFQITCAHPTHFDHVLDADQTWIRRLGGLRANASTMSHAELDEAEELDPGDPVELGLAYRNLRDRLPGLTVLGGCCGTNHRHVDAIGRACLPG
jgi:S-methylmethionine-dependent homocysteine/selenocysteine methylase